MSIIKDNSTTIDAITPDLSTNQQSSAIAVQNVSKMYRIYSRPQDRLKQMLWHGRHQFGREFWALNDISFEIAKGETMGIIGRNGSGKSTLLQIIAGTLAPTSGKIQVQGRVAALLELGSGFNPEFTGRENVFLNGSILGFSYEEIENLYDDIAAYADIGEFINQPVKLYSSGMVVRLAFAVQALVPKEILIVDEALSVGDMFFQAKCIATMKQLLDDGVTVLFVSHDTGSVKSLCRRAILLNEGRLLEIGAANKIVETYFAVKVRSEQNVVEQATSEASLLPLPFFSAKKAEVSKIPSIFTETGDFQKRAVFERIQNGKAQFVNIQLLNVEETEITSVEYGQEVILRMAIEVHEHIVYPFYLSYGYHIRDYNGVDAVYSDSIIEGKNITEAHKGNRYVIDWRFAVSLRQGNYNIAAVLSIPIDLSRAYVDFCDFIPLAVQFYVNPRKESYLYGIVHWENNIHVQSITSDLEENM